MERLYKHVFLIGIDGAGNYVRAAKTPNIDRLFETGAGTMNCLTEIPSDSAECWGSMLIGVDAQTHGLMNHIVESGTPYTNAEHPSIFSIIRRSLPDAILGAYSNWDPINNGIVERGLGVDLDTADDAELSVKICDYVKSRKPDFLFVQFDNVDHAGHTWGYGSQEHLDTISREDGYTGDIIAAAKEAGIYDDTLFIVTADHGGRLTGHGGDSDEEKLVFFVCAGKNVKKGAEITLRVRDIPAIIAHALGVPANPNWHAKLPSGIFEE